MGLDVEVIPAWTWRGFVYLMNISSWAFVCFLNISCRCVKKKPCVSATLLLLFLLYVCYPFAFWIVVYSSPIAACIYIFLRKKLSSRCNEAPIVKDEEDKTGMPSEKFSSAKGNRTFKLNGKTILSRRSRRRIILQSVDSSDPTNQLFALLGNPLRIEERKMDLIWGGAEGSFLNSPFVDELRTSSGGQQESDFVPHDGCGESSHKDGDRDGHYEAESPEEADNKTEDLNKGVEWTEDDEKDLMDLGNSDIERNKRLESLMAKRRVKKLLSMQLQREQTGFTVDALSKIAPISIAKTNLLLTPSAIHGSKNLPSSAPSVLLPMRNPFDLPYDPQEEKPNLTGDSFHQEFLVADQKDLNLSGHESFGLKSKFPGEPKNIYTTERQVSCSRFKSQPDNEPHEKLLQASLSIEDESCIANSIHTLEQDGQISVVLSSENIKLADNEKNENVMLSVCASEPDKVEDYAESKLSGSHGIQTEEPSGGSEQTFSSLYSPSEDEEVDNRDQDKVLNGPDGSISKAFIDSLRKSLIRSRSKIIARGMRENVPANQSVDISDSSSIEKTKMVNIIYEEKRAARTPSYSIASDLQVELSDGSPPLTVGTISPPDGEFLMYDADIEKEITSGSEDMWGASSHLAAVEENESRSREVHEISEEDIIGLGFREISQSPEDLIA